MIVTACFLSFVSGGICGVIVAKIFENTERRKVN